MNDSRIYRKMKIAWDESALKLDWFDILSSVL